ncbi:MAG TPA: hypothetical protein VGR00_14490, partial [Thermoanaerobaculia bacterium]|nr:hypothetical protein [Thermoanaerobaculia bacterium]
MKTRATHLATAVLIALGLRVSAPAATAPSAATASSAHHLVLPVRVNGEPKGEVAAWVSDASVFLLPSDVERLRLPDGGATETFRGEEFVDLSSLSPAVTFRFDEESVRLDLTVRAMRPGARAVVDLGRRQKPAGIVYSSDPSG